MAAIGVFFLSFLSPLIGDGNRQQASNWPGMISTKTNRCPQTCSHKNMATMQLKQKDKRAFGCVPAAHRRPHNIEDNVPFDPQKLLAMHPVIRVFSPSPASLLFSSQFSPSHAAHLSLQFADEHYHHNFSQEFQKQ
jgi:hypothetical protein